ncbi:MAG: hypothetical protein WA941_10875 [Nitrososphaeraceae archaeon]
MGFVFGAIGIGSIADVSSLSTAIEVVVWISLVSGIFVLAVIRETKVKL